MVDQAAMMRRPDETFRDMTARLKREQADRVAQVSAAWAESPAILLSYNRGDDELALLSPEMSTPEHGPLRVTFLTPDGPRGHDVGTLDKLINDMAFRQPKMVVPVTEDEVIAWTSTERYEQGAKAVAFIQADNEIRWRAGQLDRRTEADEVLQRGRPDQVPSSVQPMCEEKNAAVDRRLERAEAVLFLGEPTDLASMSVQQLELLPTEVLDRAAFGFASDDIIEVPIDQITIKYAGDLENAESEILTQAEARRQWKVKGHVPIDLALRGGRLDLEDGHHRYVSARMLGIQTLVARMTIHDNPIVALKGGNNPRWAWIQQRRNRR